MNFKKVYRPEEGDLIRVRRKQGYAHFGVATSRNTVVHYSDYGNDSILDASKVRVIETTLEEFLMGGKCEKVHPYESPFDRKEVVSRAKSLIGSMRFRNMIYNVVTNNCEHFASYIYYGEARSIQVEKATDFAVKSAGVLTAAVSFAISLANKNKKKKQEKEPLQIENKDTKKITKK